MSSKGEDSKSLAMESPLLWVPEGAESKQRRVNRQQLAYEWCAEAKEEGNDDGKK